MILQVKNVCKEYKKNTPVLKNISFNLKKGESIGLVGANGCGKTTLVEIIAGIIEPTAGNIKWSDQENSSKNIGLQFQKSNWPAGTKIKDIFNFLVGTNWVNDEYINQLIDVFELRDLIKRKISYCSGGQQQRFNCLLSMVKNPELLILDELITGLDLKMQIKIVNFINEWRKIKGATIINVSHIPEEIEQVCDRVILLKKGEVFLDDSIKNIKEKNGSLRKMLMDFYQNEK
ncbi:ABC transporter ATP-binding protein [Spiroplasma culicicola]|uniref:Peptide/nickel transport system ATP-binding protein n=1 Tax=Spiroplasma culicicola AES-1 TaxID=1276246 RepID=W6A8M0_9MOLU|nr:ABC transporter ATP-binding protein [Spiroplasma culicicola]AHI53316.1 peptide/nickel transport system ATP-binding protein [Spiroplasma culicicola AES-1]